ncbi:MAG: Asp-tRNA(Asn)/Glu-tRNA(Gln) amidotransferase subunit GatC [Micrococcaceae bacterium]
MSKIAREDVAHIASLACIDMSDKELDDMVAKIPVILQAVEQVSEVVNDSVMPTSHPMPLTNNFREDEVKPSLTQEQALSGAPDAEDGRFKVPAILDGE